MTPANPGSLEAKVDGCTCPEVDKLESVEHVRTEERSAWMAEVARLRAMLPTDTERAEIEACCTTPTCPNEVVDGWLARLTPPKAPSVDVRSTKTPKAPPKRGE